MYIKLYMLFKQVSLIYYFKYQHILYNLEMKYALRRIDKIMDVLCENKFKNM